MCFRVSWIVFVINSLCPGAISCRFLIFLGRFAYYTVMSHHPLLDGQWRSSWSKYLLLGGCLALEQVGV